MFNGYDKNKLVENVKVSSFLLIGLHNIFRASVVVCINEQIENFILNKMNDNF